MPDTHWQTVPPDEARHYEQRRVNDKPPTSDHTGYLDYKKTIPPNPKPGEPHIIIEVDEWSSVTCQPPPQLVMETCDKCDGHSHEVKILFGNTVGTPPGGIQGSNVTDQQHVADNFKGSHLGELYTNAKCRGTIITCSLLTWSISGRQITTWHKRTIDHVKNGFIWLSDISQDPCPKKSGMKGHENEKSYVQRLEEAFSAEGKR